MEDNAKLIEQLLGRAVEYGERSFELIKLKALEKTSDVVSSFAHHSFVFVLIASFMLFFNLGLAFWLGEILGQTYYGFLVMSAFYGLVVIFLQLFMKKRLKEKVRNYVIKLLLK
jgi:hypothetical protein